MPTKCLGSLATSADNYLFALARGTGTQLATIGSDDALRTFDATTCNITKTLPNCHSGVSCLEAGGPACTFVTGGRDGVVRCWDGRAQKIAEMADPNANGIASLACHGHFIAVGTESLKEGLGDVSVLLFDTRNTRAPLRLYTESHTDTVTELQFHPAQPHVLLSGSTDGLVSIFDVNHDDEDDALLQVLNPRSAVHCAGFIAQHQAYVVSTDEQYSIYTLAKTASDEEELPPPLQFGDVRQRLDCMYVIDVLVQPDGPPLIAYGHNEKRTLGISSLGSPGAWDFGQKIDLPGAHGDDVVRDVLLMEKRAFSCGEDGMVKAWSLG
ncbi:hypothetical protein BST61_g6899 [Cercospora zeina]